MKSAPSSIICSALIKESSSLKLSPPSEKLSGVIFKIEKIKKFLFFKNLLLFKKFCFCKAFFNKISIFLFFLATLFKKLSTLYFFFRTFPFFFSMSSIEVKTVPLTFMALLFFNKIEL